MPLMPNESDSVTGDLAPDDLALDKHAADEPAADVAADELAPDPAYEARVLRAFVKDGRLVSLPARQKKKLVVLRYLLDRVLPDDAAVEERELNARLAAWHPDVAALRRYLVNAGLVDRAGMVYRRAVPELRGAEPTGPPFV
jgi:hypothetical protein